jgi:thioredoxin 1
MIIISCAAYGHKLSESSKQDEPCVSLEDFKKITGNKNKTTLVYFHAKWCMICAKTQPILDALEKEHPGISVLKIDTDHNKEIALEFEIDALPVLMFYDKGTRSWIHVGIIEKNNLYQKLGL